MLKPLKWIFWQTLKAQPPLGGCVLKLAVAVVSLDIIRPAAFRRLCVETAGAGKISSSTLPAAFRRLCVETYTPPAPSEVKPLPAAFRRLCVETIPIRMNSTPYNSAAFRRLCVETSRIRRVPMRVNPATFGRLCVKTTSATLPNSAAVC